MSQVLVLNASYEPINICGIQRAIVLLLKGAARAEEFTQNYLRSPSIMVQAPSVIRLVHYVKIEYQKTYISKRNIFIRDQFTCQYCGKQFDSSELTLDHILPQSRGGKDIWENIVTACRKCNIKKANKTPFEAGVKLLKPPRPFGAYYFLQWVRFKGKDNEQWRKYLFY